MKAFSEKFTNAEMPLQILLFVDKRPSSRERIRLVQECLSGLRASYPFELQVIDVGEQPYLAELFRLVATPALVKIHPEPRHTLAGSNLIDQLRQWWPYWQRSVDDYLANPETFAIAEDLDDLAKTPLVELPQEHDKDVSAPLSFANQVAETESASLGELSTLPDSKNFKAVGVRRSIRSIARSAEVIQLSDEVFQLKREKEELEHQLKFKDQIIAMLAHDLRNPLTAASLALETLEMGHDSETGWTSRLTPALTAQLLKHARTQTRAVDRMITDILQAARGANSEMQIHPQKLNLRVLCLEVLDDLRDRLEAKSQQIKTDIPSDLPVVLADGERLRQVVVNLLDNAIKYTPVGGTIQVSALHRTTQKIQISICDDGPGIPEETQELIFEDRFRLQRDEGEDGYGIGLSLCQRIIRAHYGQIWVDSTLDQGSCFHFTLPVFRM